MSVRQGSKPGSYESANRWSVVVIGRLAHHTVWAPRSYPMGFVQSDISKQIIYGLSEVLNDTPFQQNSSSSSSNIAAVTPNPITPFSTQLSSYRSSATKGSIMSCNKKDKSEYSETKDVTFVVKEDLPESGLSSDSMESRYEYQKYGANSRRHSEGEDRESSIENDGEGLLFIFIYRYHTLYML